MTGLWKPWKAKSRLPPVSTGPWKSRQKQATFPHSHSSDGEADGKVENQKQVSHFPTAISLSQNKKPGTVGRASPPAPGGAPLTSANDVYHSVTLSGEATR
jgi:hypothetical protein